MEEPWKTHKPAAAFPCTSSVNSYEGLSSKTLGFKLYCSKLRKQENKSELEFELAIFSQTSKERVTWKHDHAIVINMCQSAPGIMCTLARQHQACYVFYLNALFMRRDSSATQKGRRNVKNVTFIWEQRLEQTCISAQVHKNSLAPSLHLWTFWRNKYITVKAPSVWVWQTLFTRQSWK